MSESESIEYEATVSAYNLWTHLNMLKQPEMNLRLKLWNKF